MAAIKLQRLIDKMNLTNLTPDIDISGIKVKINTPLSDGPLKVGDTIQVLINQLYIFDDKSTTTLFNKCLDSSNLYYI